MNITLEPRCLQWARERAGLDIPELAKKLKLKVDKIIAWEETGEITLGRAERLARVTHTPIGYLLLPEPIADEMPIRDFRTVEMQDISRPSVDLLDTIYDAQGKQDWYRDYVIANGGTPLAFVGSLNISDNISQAAKSIRDAIAWETNLSAQSSSWEGALSQFINSARRVGILVMRSGIVGTNTYRSLSVDEFRGFSLADGYAPLIFINGNDAKVAQMFTLAHELVHIWLGESGVSNLRFTYSPNLETERFCNSVAAELLVPMQELDTLWSGMESDADRIALAARHFKVSKLVILRRLHDAEYLSDTNFRTLYANELTQYDQRKTKSAGGGGDFYVTTRSRFGDRFLYALIGSVFEGGTPYSEAMQLLGVSKSETVRELSRQMGVPV